MINHTHKFVFVAINKTGSTTIHTSLSNLCSQDSKGLHPHSSLSQILHKDNSISNYFKFAFVRNPWDRCMSIYFYRRKKYGQYKNTSFTKFIKELPDRTFLDWYHVNVTDPFAPPVSLPQFFFLANKSEKISMDYIGRFENLQEDFDTICDKIGLPKQQLPHENKNKHKHYTEYYDEETKSIVAEKYAKDIEYFNYEFGE